VYFAKVFKNLDRYRKYFCYGPSE